MRCTQQKKIINGISATALFLTATSRQNSLTSSPISCRFREVILTQLNKFTNRANNGKRSA